MIEAKEIGRVTRSCERRETVGERSVSYRLIKVEADFSLYLGEILEKLKKRAKIVYFFKNYML